MTGEFELETRGGNSGESSGAEHISRQALFAEFAGVTPEALETRASNSKGSCSPAYLQDLWRKYPPPSHQYDSHALRGNPAYEQATKCFLRHRRAQRS